MKKYEFLFEIYNSCDIQFFPIMNISWILVAQKML